MSPEFQPSFAPEAPGSGQPGQSSMGYRLRRRRRSLGLSLQALAEQAGLAAGFISLMERDLAPPSLSSLIAVSRVLGLDPVEFFDQPPSPEATTRAGARPSYGVALDHLRYERVSASFPGNVLRALIIHEAPGHRSEPIQHEGEELFFVLVGGLTVEVEGVHHVLGPGDSIHFESRRVHSSWNHTSGTTTLLHTCTMDVFGDLKPGSAASEAA